MSKAFLTRTMANVATVTSKGQITLPAGLRRKYGMKRGTRLVFVEAGQDLRILKEQDLERMFEVFDRLRSETRLTRSELDAVVERVRKRLWRERNESGS